MEENGLTFDELASDPNWSEVHRQLMNADIRCTVISNFGSEDVLYDIFHRVNSAGVPLSTQELRQALIKGEFGVYLVELTSEPQPIHQILGLDGPDPRMRDVEIILRHFAFAFFRDEYGGNLKAFLDDAMKKLTKNWPQNKAQIAAEYERFNSILKRLNLVFLPSRVGRKLTNGKWEWRFNKALFEVEVFTFAVVSDSEAEAKKKDIETGFASLCNDSQFRDSIEATTKTVDQYELRFKKFSEMLEHALGKSLVGVPFVR